MTRTPGDSSASAYIATLAGPAFVTSDVAVLCISAAQPVDEARIVDNLHSLEPQLCLVPKSVGGIADGVVMNISEKSTPAEIGALGEQFAVEHLEALKWRILARNWRCRYGEVDVIACDDAAGAVVFVEVKTRTGDGFGGLPEAVTAAKVRRLRRLAGLWLAGQDRHWRTVRIDVIGVRIGRRRAAEISHLTGIG